MRGQAGQFPEVEETARNAHYVLLAARFNQHIVEQMLAAAFAALQQAGVPDEHIEVMHVPGAFELPQAAANVIGLDLADAVIALGTVIRGETAHFDYVSSSCAHGLSQVGINYGIPVLLGVLTTENEAQALQRASADGGNKGAEVAHAAMQMVALYARMDARLDAAGQ